LDLSLANLKAMSTEAYDFTFNYDNMLFGGNLSLIGRATYTDSLVIQPFADSPAVDYAGVVPYGYVVEGNPTGALRFRGSLSAQWSKDALSFGWQTRYMSGYYLRTDRAVVLDQGSARVDSQMYHDLNVTYKFPFKATLRFGINNVFNTKPPVDATQSPLYYSAYGDPRLRSFYLGISKSF
jgi:outer membrane receptor protein involved in Fe transport